MSLIIYRFSKDPNQTLNTQVYQLELHEWTLAHLSTGDISKFTIILNCDKIILTFNKTHTTFDQTSPHTLTILNTYKTKIDQR